MKFEIGEVLSRAWQITWKYKTLWIIGILFGLLVSFMFPLMFSPLLLLPILHNTRMDLTPVVIFTAVFIAVFFLFTLALYPVSVLAQTSLTLGVLEVEGDGEHLSVRELLKRSLPFFWRVLGLMLLVAIGMTVIMIAIQAIFVLLAIVTFGLGTMCITPLMLLMYPAIYAAMVWMEQTMNGIIIDNLTIREAARQAWSLVRNNLLSMALITIVIYFGVGLVTGIVMMPMMIPVFIMPLGFLEHEINWTLIAISAAAMVVSLPLFAVLSGWVMIFTKSTWVLTYLRLTRPSETPPSVLQATT